MMAKIRCATDSFVPSKLPITSPSEAMTSTVLSSDCMACGPLRTIRSQCFARSLANARRRWSSVSRAKPTSHCPVWSLRAWRRRRRFRSGAARAARPSWRFTGGYPNRSIIAGGGDADQAVARGKKLSAGGQHLFGRNHRDHPAGRRIATSTGPLTRITSCPAARAASANARPIRPLEALVR